MSSRVGECICDFFVFFLYFNLKKKRGLTWHYINVLDNLENKTPPLPPFTIIKVWKRHVGGKNRDSDDLPSPPTGILREWEWNGNSRGIANTQRFPFHSRITFPEWQRKWPALLGTYKRSNWNETLQSRLCSNYGENSILEIKWNGQGRRLVELTEGS